MKTIGFVLVAVGILALIYGGIGFNRDRTVLDMGSMSVTASERHDYRIPTAAGVLVLIGGVTMLMTSRRRA